MCGVGFTACTLPVGTARKVTTLVDGSAVKLTTRNVSKPRRGWTPHALAYADDGTVWASDSRNHRVLQISATGIVTVLAGSNSAGATDGTLTEARFDTPRGLSWDGEYLWVADTGNQSIRRIDMAGTVQTPKVPARLQAPVAVLSEPELDVLWIAEASGEILRWRADRPRELETIMELGSHRVIRELRQNAQETLQILDNTGLWELVAGQLRPVDAQVDTPRRGGFTHFEGQLFLSTPFQQDKLRLDGQPLTLESVSPALRYPGVMASSAAGIVLADVGSQAIYQLKSREETDTSTPEFSLSVLARSGTQGFGERRDNEDLSLPHGVVYLENEKKLWAGDYFHNRILEIDEEGNAVPRFENNEPRLTFPTGMVQHPEGHVFISSSGSHQIFVYREGKLEVFAGSGERGLRDGTSEEAQFWLPWGLTLDPEGNLYVADHGNHAIRKITPEGQVTTLAGNGRPGFENARGAQARFHHPVDVLFYQNKLLISDSWNHQLRFLNLRTQRVTSYAGNTEPGLRDGSRTRAAFYSPSGLTAGPEGSVYIADTWNHRVRQMSARGEVTTLAGDGRHYNWNSGSQDGPVARFQQPRDVYYHAQNNQVYVADTGNNNLRVIDP